MLKHRAPAPDAEALAIQALAAIAGDPGQLGRFLAATGIGPETLRSAAAQPAFLASVLDFLSQDEAALLAFAANAGVNPASIPAARERLANAGAKPR